MQREELIGKATEVVVAFVIIGAVGAVAYSGVLPRACEAFADKWADLSGAIIAVDPVTSSTEESTSSE